MSKKKNQKKNTEHIFCAYAKDQKEFVEYLQQAKNQINKHTKNNYELHLWEKMNINGNFIIEKIKEEIGTSDFFICELSEFNWNVFFELGYAIGHEKSVKLFLKDDSSQKEEFRKLKLLSGCGYQAYKSNKEIHESLKQKFNSQDTSELKEFGKQCQSNTVSDQLLIISNTREEQAILEIQQHLEEKTISYKFNNTKEVGYRTKEWYEENISKSYGVIIHLAFDKEHKTLRENAENSFIAGICDAIDKPYMFIGHRSIDPPMDYQEHFMKYDKDIEVTQCVDTFVNKYRNSHLVKQQVAEKKVVEEQKHKVNTIKSYLNFIAEDEHDKLLDYFVENQFYTNALDNQGIKIIVGRKGTGKTALFRKLKNELASSRNIITAILNPDKSDFRNVIEALSKCESHKEKILSTLWEIVILSTFCREIKNIEQKPYNDMSDDNEFMKSLEQHKNIGLFKVLQEYQETKENEHILQIHRESFYQSIKNEFYSYIRNNKKYLKINIISDNLDCIWDGDVDRDIQAGIIKSLFDYAIEFRNKLQEYDIKVNFCFFLREDIFTKIKETVKFEIDKIEGRTMKMNWETRKNDLRSIVDARFSKALNITSPEDIEKAWLNHFELTSKKAFDKIFKHVIITRPRDLLIYISNLFLSSNDGIIRENDFNAADEEYKSFIYDNMKLEINSIFDKSDITFDKISQKFNNLYEDMKGHEFMKTIQNELEDKEESDKFLERLIELNYLTCRINNTIYNDVKEIQNKFKEKKFFFFHKNKIYFRFKQ